MGNDSNPKLVLTLFVGDCLILLVMTVAGFVQHGTLDSGVIRVLATFCSTFIAWLLVAPFIRAYDPHLVLNPKELWRPVWASAVAIPLAAFFRGLLLDIPIMPVFILVFAAVIALGILVWRAFFLIVNNGLRQTHG